jgi:hypothetical protein
MAKKLSMPYPRNYRPNDPRIVSETARTLSIAVGDEFWVAVEIRKTWIRRNRKFLEAVIKAGGRGRPPR